MPDALAIEGFEGFVPLTVGHLAANNLGSGIVALPDNAELERGSYRNRFIAVTADTPIVPASRAKPTAPGLQTALVVGLPDAAVTSTRDHQVRIQFPWQRGQNPNRGGLTDTGSSAHPDGHAPGDDTSGTWVRVAERFSPYCVSHVLDALLERGAGIAINPGQPASGDNGVDWVFSYGDLPCLKMFGQFRVKHHDLPPLVSGTETLSGEEKLLLGSPSDTFLPAVVRAHLDDYMRAKPCRN